jgi:hypothetical protein
VAITPTSRRNPSFGRRGRLTVYQAYKMRARRRRRSAISI